MIVREVDAGSFDAGFSPMKKRILLLLKKEGAVSLGELADTLRISKMATLKHTNALEAKGLLERSFRGGARGRPRVVFRLHTGASRLFPEAYAHMTETALEFIEHRLGRAAVHELLERRTQELYDRHRRDFEGENLRERVGELARVRDEGGYMAEVGASRKDTFELLEFNCPIYAVAQKYGEACAVEVDLFRKLLRADVEATHRVVAGDPVCRFMIRKRAGKHG